MSRRLTEHAEFCHQRCNNNIYRATEEGDLDLYNRTHRRFRGIESRVLKKN